MRNEFENDEPTKEGDSINNSNDEPTKGGDSVNNPDNKSVKEEDVIYENVSIADLFKEVHKNSGTRKKQIDDTIINLASILTSVQDAVAVSPIIKDLLQTSVNNDNLLVNILQIAIKSKEKKADKVDDNSVMNEKFIPYKIVEELQRNEQKFDQNYDDIMSIMKEKITK